MVGPTSWKDQLTPMCESALTINIIVYYLGTALNHCLVYITVCLKCDINCLLLRMCCVSYHLLP